MRRWLVRIGLALALLLALAAGAVWLALAASLPRYAGTIAVAGLERPVRIVRDAHAIPHVEAASEADAYLAMGYLHGQDRLWQMEFDRLAGQGRLAEVLGEAALPIDRYLRTLGLARARRGRPRARSRRPTWPCSRPTPRASTPRSPATASGPAARVPAAAPPARALAAGRQPAAAEAAWR